MGAVVEAIPTGADILFRMSPAQSRGQAGGRHAGRKKPRIPDEGRSDMRIRETKIWEILRKEVRL